MKNTSPSSQTTIIALLLAYWVPLTVLCIYASPRKSWTLGWTGLLLSTIGTLVLWLLLKHKEEKITPKAEPFIQEGKKEAEVPNHEFLLNNEKLKKLESTILEYEHKQSHFDLLLKEKQNEVATANLELERLQQHIESVQQELEDSKSYLNEQVSNYKNIILDHQKTIADLRDTLQSKQQITTQLESKVRDLSYEIKTILQIAEGQPKNAPEKSPFFIAKEVKEESGKQEEAIHTFEEALMLLKRSLDSAQRMSGSAHFSKGSRFKELPLENYALDLRRLFDHFQNEAEGVLFVYSSKEEKMLFVTNQIFNLLGIDAERFLKYFSEIIQDGKEDWDRAIGQLTYKNESKLSLSMKTKAGGDMAVTCVLGIIPTGLFRNHVLGVLFSPITSSTYKLSPAVS